MKPEMVRLLRGDSCSSHRRRLVFAALAGLTVTVPVAAQQCRSTPRDQLGPYYSGGAPEQSNLCVSGSGGRERLLVSGRVLSADCKPLAGALVEVWHADANGDYSGFARGKKDDAACLLRASLKTDAEGKYSFSSILPAAYPGRPRHIHYRVSHAAHATLVTQLYFGRERGVADELVTAVQRDDKGVSRAVFDITLARAG
jgi:protocatechuate 3,4-dioxygenase beta subunit